MEPSELEAEDMRRVIDPFQSYVPSPEEIAQTLELETRNSRIFAIQHACTLHNGLGTSAEHVITEAERMHQYIMNGLTNKPPVDLRPVHNEE